MLSKVLKGSDANQAPKMGFAATLGPASQARQPLTSSPLPDGESGTENPATLRERIRTLESGMDTAKRDAFDAGLRQGEQDARTALAPILGRMNASIAEVVAMRPELRRCAEKDAVELSLKIARRVLHRELSIDSNALNALARVVFDRLTRSESWQITVHPQFADAIRGALPAGRADRIRIETDPSCAPGTVVVRCSEGVIDASIDSQLAEIGRGLTDRLIHK